MYAVELWIKLWLIDHGVRTVEFAANTYIPLLLAASSVSSSFSKQLYTMDDKTVNTDIESFLASELSKHWRLKKLPHEMKTLVQDSLRAKSDGM